MKDTKAKPSAKSDRRKKVGGKQFLGTFGTTILLQVFMIAQGVILARALGPEGRGEFVAIILWPTIVANLGLFGTRLSIVRTAAVSEDYGAVMRAAMLLALGLSVLTVVLGLCLLQFLLPDSSSDILWLARIYMVLFVPAFMLSSLMQGIDQGLGDFKKVNFFRLIAPPVYVLLLVLLLVVGRANLTFCITAMLVSLWLGTMWRVTSMLTKIGLRGPVTSLQEILRKAVPFAVSSMIAQFTSRGDRILLLWLLTERDMGIYVVAFSAASVLGSAPRSVGMVVQSITAQEAGRKGFARLAEVFRMSTLVVVTMAICLSLAAYLLLPLVYGREFIDSRVTVLILSAGFIFFGLASILIQALAGQGKPLAGTFSRLGGLVLMVNVSLMLHDSLGLNGVAIGFVAAQALTLCCMIRLTVSHYEYASFAQMLPRSADTQRVICSLLQHLSKAWRRVRRPKASMSPSSVPSDE